MDSAYLLALQHFREVVPFFTPIMCMISDFINSPWPVAFFCLIYWAYDKELGLWMLTSNVLGLFFNGVVKITACVPRPWVRDLRITPYKSAITSATGYSFPSGHSTEATIFYGSIGIAKKPFCKAINIIITISVFFLAAITMFSRNYLGVHTAQDVIAGFAITMIIVILTKPLIKFTARCNKTQDIFILIIFLFIAAISIIYTSLKNYPTQFINGNIIADTKIMRKDTYYSIGLLIGYAIGVFIEKRFISFKIDKESKKQLTIAICAVMVLYFLYSLRGYLKGGGANAVVSIFTTIFMGVYVFIIVPLVIKRLVNNKG